MLPNFMEYSTTFFINIATNIGLNDKIKDFDFHVVDTETMMQMIKNVNPRKLLAAIAFLENLFELL